MFNNLIKQYSDRIFAHKKMFPFGKLLKECFVFPIDYNFGRGRSSWPAIITLSVTNRCNADCNICYLDKKNNKKAQDLDIRLVKKIVGETKFLKPVFIITGGEPFLRKDILKIIELIKSNRFPLGIFTNGILLDPRKIDYLCRMKVDYVFFSLLGTREIHDRITSVPGAFDKLVKNIEYFCRSKRQTKVIINTVINNANIECLQYCIDIARKYKADAVNFKHLNFLSDEEVRRHCQVWGKISGGGNIIINQYRCNAFKDNGAFKADILKRLYSARGRIELPVEFIPNLKKDEIGPWYSNNFNTNRRCLYPWRGMDIGPDGNVYLCHTYNYSLGNISRQKISEIWNSLGYIKLRLFLRKGLFPACARCCKL